MIVSVLDFRYGFIFAACNLLGAVVVYLFVHESVGMSLENVDAVCPLFTINYRIVIILHSISRCIVTLESDHGLRVAGPHLDLSQHWMQRQAQKRR